MKLTGVLVSCALGGAMVLGSGADARSQEARSGGSPRNGGSPQATGVTEPLLADPTALAKAESIVAEREAATGRSFDPAYRARLVNTLASSPTDDLKATSSDVIAPETNFLGSNFNDYVYTPVSPCRIIDTRVAGGIMAAGSF